MGWPSDVCRMFSLRDKGDLEMVMLWEERFVAAGYSASDLTQALSDMVTGPFVPLNRPDVLVKLQASLVAMHRRRVMANEQLDEAATCVECSGSGRIVVPAMPGMVTAGGHVLNGTEQGKWLAVLCRCIAGRCLRGRSMVGNGGDKPMMRIEDYDRHYPGRESREKRHTEATELAFEALKAARHQDRQSTSRPRKVSSLPPEDVQALEQMRDDAGVARPAAKPVNVAGVIQRDVMPAVEHRRQESNHDAGFDDGGDDEQF